VRPGASSLPRIAPEWTAGGIAVLTVGACLFALAVLPSSPKLFAAGAVGGLVAAALLTRPEWTVPAFAGLTWFSLRSFGSLPSPVEGGALLLVVFSVLRMPRTGRLAGEVGLVIALIGLPLLASSILSQEGARLPVGGLWELAFLVIPAFAIRTADGVERVVVALVATGLVLGLGAMYSVLVEPTALFGVSTAPPGAPPVAPRAIGPLGEPNFFALSLAALVPLAVYLAAAGPRRLGMATLPVLFGGIFATGSRAALAAALCVVVAHVLLSRERRQRFGLVLLIAGAIALLPLFAGQAAGSADRTVGGRVTENRVAVAMFEDHPVAGVGEGRYPLLYRDYARHIGNDPRVGREPHSLPLQIAAEQGIAGLLGWVAAAAVILARGRARVLWRLPVGRALLLALAAYMLGSLTLHGSGLRHLFLLAGLALACASTGPRLVGARPPA
jgi:O-antigen ligase